MSADINRDRPGMGGTGSEIGGHAGERASSIGSQVGQRIQEVKGTFDNARGVVVDRTREAAKVTNEYVNTNPWMAVGISAGIGLMLGVLIGRQR